MVTPTRTDGSTPELKRQIGLWDATAIFVGVILGSGIFVAPSGVARATDSLVGAIGIWALGGLIAACGAAVYAECAARLPYDGGFYVFYRAVFGEGVAFVGGWAALLVTYPASIAAIGFICAAYLGRAVPALAGFEALCAATAVVFAAMLNVIGVRENAFTQRLLTTIKVLAVAAVCVAALAEAPKTSAVAASLSPSTPLSHGWTAFLSALMIVLWTYSGWSDITLVSGELRKPARDLSRTVLLGIGTLVLLYALVQTAVTVLLPREVAAGSPQVLSDAVSTAFGVDAGRLIAVVVVVCTFGALNSTIMVVSRLGYAMSNDGLVPRWFTALNRRGVPMRSVWAIGFATLSYVAWGDFSKLLGMFTFSVWIFYALTAVALFILRRREQGEPLAWRAPFGPLAPIIVLVTAAAMTIGLLWSETQRGLALWGALLLTAGVPAYFVWHAVQKRRGPESTTIG